MIHLLSPKVNRSILELQKLFSFCYISFHHLCFMQWPFNMASRTFHFISFVSEKCEWESLLKKSLFVGIHLSVWKNLTFAFLSLQWAVVEFCQLSSNHDVPYCTDLLSIIFPKSLFNCPKIFLDQSWAESLITFDFFLDKKRTTDTARKRDCPLPSNQIRPHWWLR